MGLLGSLSGSVTLCNCFWSWRGRGPIYVLISDGDSYCSADNWPLGHLCLSAPALYYPPLGKAGEHAPVREGKHSVILARAHGMALLCPSRHLAVFSTLCSGCFQPVNQIETSLSKSFLLSGQIDCYHHPEGPVPRNGRWKVSAVSRSVIVLRHWNNLSPQ